MAKAVHTMVRVLDLDRSITFYQDAFGLAEADRFDFKIKLTRNKGQTEPHELGNGYGHSAVSVEDLEADHISTSGRSASSREGSSRWRDGEAVGKFFFVADPDGYRLEVLHRGVRTL